MNKIKVTKRQLHAGSGQPDHESFSGSLACV